MRVTSRSRLEAGESCPRKLYWGYLHNGRGIQRKGFDPDLLMGSSYHVGIEHLLKGMTEDEAAARAVIHFSKAINTLGLAPQVIETEAGFEQQPFRADAEHFMVNLVEALVRGWARVRLPKLLKEYEVLDVEREEAYQLTPDLRFLSRCDFITRRRFDDSLFIHNLKGVKYPDGAWRKKFQYDQQTLSELLGVEERLGCKAGGVIIEGLVKGTKNVEYPRGSGARYNNSPLVWAWVGPDNPPFPADVKIKYEYVDEMGKNRRLGPTYSRVPAYTVMPIREWIDKVEREAPELLAAQFVTLPAVLRNDFEIESWKTSTIAKEDSTAFNLEHNKVFVEMSPKTMDVQWPKHTSNGNCLGYGDTACAFFRICWENASPDDETLYMPRVYNHPAESEAMEEEK